MNPETETTTETTEAELTAKLWTSFPTTKGRTKT